MWPQDESCGVRENGEVVDLCALVRVFRPRVVLRIRRKDVEQRGLHAAQRCAQIERGRDRAADVEDCLLRAQLDLIDVQPPSEINPRRGQQPRGLPAIIRRCARDRQRGCIQVQRPARGRARRRAPQVGHLHLELESHGVHAALGR